MSDSKSTPPTSWDSVKYSIAAGLMVTYLPAFLAAAAYFGSRGAIAVFTIVTVGVVLLRCSGCSQSLFNHGDLWKPWPWRACPTCARPLLQEARSSEDAS